MSTSAARTDLQASFRDVMAEVATPVSVVTTLTEGRPHGTTVSAFASLSMDPPMVLVSLNRASGLLTRIRTAGRFGVNVLGAAQADVALAFAGKGDARFEGVTWQEHAGVPRIAGSPGWLACEVAELVEGGDHVLVLGHVLAAETAVGAPLTYHARAFGTHQPVQ